MGLEGVRAEGSPRGLFIMAVGAGMGWSRELNLAIMAVCACTFHGSIRRFKAIMLGSNSLNVLLITLSTIFVFTPE